MTPLPFSAPCPSCLHVRCVCRLQSRLAALPRGRRSDEATREARALRWLGAGRAPLGVVSRERREDRRHREAR